VDRRTLLKGVVAGGGALALGGLPLVGCGGEEPAPGDDDYPLASHAPNHPNSVVAKRLQQQPPAYPLRFVLVGDTHIPSANGRKVFALIRKQLVRLEPRPAFVVIVGDCVQTGAVPEHLEYMSLIDAMPMPIFSVIGNHEMYPGFRWNYTKYHGPENFSFDCSNCRFVALNDIIPGYDGLTEPQLKWLEGELADPAFPNRFVLVHAPPPALPPPWGAPAFRGEERFYEIIERAEVCMLACGHVHEYRHRLIRGVHYVVTGGGGGGQDPLLQDPNTQAIFHHFSLVTIEADGSARLEVVPAGESVEPQHDFTFHFETTPPKV
jgi:predicted phosphodiesterase